MKILNFNNSVKISTATYLVTSLIGLILYIQIFSLFDLNTLGRFSVYQTICFFGSKFISLSTPYSLMKHVSEDDRARVNLNYLISALLIVLFFIRLFMCYLVLIIYLRSSKRFLTLKLYYFYQQQYFCRLQIF